MTLVAMVSMERKECRVIKVSWAPKVHRDLRESRDSKAMMARTEMTDRREFRAYLAMMVLQGPRAQRALMDRKVSRGFRAILDRRAFPVMMGQTAAMVLKVCKASREYRARPDLPGLKDPQVRTGHRD